MLGANAQVLPAAQDRPEVVSLSLYLGQIPSLTVSAAGRDALFLLDTAGGLTTVTPLFATNIGCQPWGQITRRQA